MRQEVLSTEVMVRTDLSLPPISQKDIPRKQKTQGETRSYKPFTTSGFFSAQKAGPGSTTRANLQTAETEIIRAVIMCSQRQMKTDGG